MRVLAFRCGDGGRGGRCRAAVVIDHRQARAALAQARPAREQRLRVPVARRFENLRHRPLLAHLALTHHDHVVGDLADHAEVVADEQHAHAVARFQARQQLEDLALHRHVERRGRLVGDQQLRLAGERHRDHHALLLAARQLVRIRGKAPLRLRQADLGEQAFGALPGGAARQPQMPDQRLGDLVADREHRVQRCHRLLEHARDVAAAQALQLGQACGEQVAALEADAARALGVVGQQVEDRHRGDALARARLADQRDGRVLGHVESNTAHRIDTLDRAARLDDAKGDAQVSNAQQHRVTPPHAASDRAHRAARRSSAKTR